jgi:hypothetical protein
MAGAHTAFAVLSGMALLEEETPSTFREAMASKDRDEYVDTRQTIRSTERCEHHTCEVGVQDKDR